MSDIEKQVRDTYYQAFYDSIDETVNSKSPDYEWIVRLYLDIRDRLLRYIKKGTDTYRIIDDQFDEKLFEQMITNDVFDKQSMIALINGSFNMVLRLEAPERDKATLESRQRVFESEPEKIVSTFIREINQCLDLIDVDFINLFAEKKN
jgi:hypothetical protein